MIILKCFWVIIAYLYQYIWEMYENEDRKEYDPQYGVKLDNKWCKETHGILKHCF